MSSLLAEMYAAAEKYLFDVALVTNDRAMYPNNFFSFCFF